MDRQAGVLATSFVTIGLVWLAQPAQASITCRDLLKLCKAHKHPLTACMRSYENCYKTGRWIGPDRIERLVTRR